MNPLHTALAVLGCLLGYTKISEEMKDEDLVRLIKKIGYVEGLPVVTDPKILNPKEFIDTVIDVRVPNPFMWHLFRPWLPRWSHMGYRSG